MTLGHSHATVALTGMMGCGKSTVAAALARLLRLPVVCTDARLVARAGKPIARIFAEEGEPAFRALERAEVAAPRGPCVLDLGGGAFCDAASAARLLATATVVFLDVSPGEASRRIAAAAAQGAPVRPLAASWPALLARRLPLYRRAHVSVEVDGRSPDAIARVVYDRVRAVRARAAAHPGAPHP